MKTRAGFRIMAFAQLTARRMVFLTNNFTLPGVDDRSIIQKTLESRMFFKWIKQYLRIKSFFGQSKNAVRIQIWIAFIVYLLVVTILRKRPTIDRSRPKCVFF